MATGGLYGNSPIGSIVAAPGAESQGLYGNTTNFGGTYFEWFIFYVSDVQPATPTGGSWSFTTNTGTPPTDWLASPPVNPLNIVWVSIGLVNSKSTAAISWSTPGKFSYSSGLPILSANGIPLSGDGQADQLYIQLDVTPNAIWFKEVGTWVQLTGSSLYVDLVSNQSIGGIKVFTSPISGSVSGTAGNVTGIVAIENGGTNATTAAAALSNLGAYPASNPAGYTNNTGTVTSVAATVPTGLSIAGSPITTSGTLAITNAAGYAIPTTSSQTNWDAAYADRLKWDGGATNLVAATGRTSLGLGSAAVLTAGAANGVATLDSGGTVPLSQIPASIQGGVSYQGAWNASTNTPALTSGSGTKGYYYVVSVAGSTNLDGVTNWNVGDWAIFNGTVWQKIDNTDAVTSVNGYTGTVVLTYTDVGAASAAQGALADTAVQSIASADGSIVVTATGTAIDLAVSQTSPASVLVEQVRNTTGATLTKGTAVYISGATGQIPTVSKALATSDATSAQTLGLITSDLANNSNGYVTITGLVTNINTSAYTDGAQLYLSPTTAGTLTATKPYAPQHLVYVAIVAHAHPTQGKLIVSVQNGYEMDELHNVSAQSPSNGQTLVYNTTTSLWEKSFAPVISGTTINSTTIGATTPSTGDFTTITASADSSFNSTGAVKLSTGTTGERPTGAAGKLRFNTTTTEFEGYNGTAWASVGGSSITNDTSTATNLYPLFASTTTGTASSVFTSNAQYLFKPSTGELSVTVPRASNGIVVNSATVSSNYTIAAGDNGASAGPISVTSGIAVTVSSGSRWVVS